MNYELVAGLFLLALVTTYALYPACLLLLRRARSRSAVRRDVSPAQVAVLVSTYNPPPEFGESWRHYPPDVEILVYDDCSDQPVRPPHGTSNVRVVRGRERVGKNRGLNHLLSLTARPLLVFTDDSSQWSPGALEALIAPLADPRVGCSVGKLRLPGSEGLYWRFEEWLKDCEARDGEMIGATGGAFALRRELVPRGFTPGMNNDFEAALVTLAAERHVVAAPEATIAERERTSASLQWRRKVRIISRAVCTIRSYFFQVSWRIRLRLVAHKLARYLAMVWQIGLLAVCIAGAVHGSQPLLAATALQLAGYGLAAWGLLAGPRAGRLAALAAYINVVNAAALVGLVRGLAGRPVDVWSPTALAPHDVTRAARRGA